MSRSSRPRRLVPLAAGLLALSSGLAIAQTPATQPPADSSTPAAPVVPDPVIDLELSSGNVRDYINYLQDVTGLNIVLLNDRGVDPSKIQMPPLKLKQMPASAAITLLGDLPYAHIYVEPRDKSWLVIARSDDNLAPGEFKARPAPPPAVTRVFSLERVFFGDPNPLGPPADERDCAKTLAEKVPQTLQLIEQALSVGETESGEPAQIKLHQPTNTLIVRGTPEQLATISEVLKAVGPPVVTDQAKAFAAKLEEVQAQADHQRLILEQELQARREAVPRYQNEIAALRANLEIAEQKLRALGGTAGESKPTTSPAKP